MKNAAVHLFRVHYCFFDFLIYEFFVNNGMFFRKYLYFAVYKNEKQKEFCEI